MEKLKIEELKRMLEGITYEEFIKLKQSLREDSRNNIQTLIDKQQRKFEAGLKEIEEYNTRRNYELKLLNKGYKFIAGVDEVGRGPLAGPVYAAAVILDPEVIIAGIKDSKKLSEKKREILSKEIREKSLAYSIGCASEEEIDRLNILNATKLAMTRAIEGLSIKPDYILIDALKLENIQIPQTGIIKGDDLSVSIGAASIVAKVERDKYMDRISEMYPEYLLSKNKGYGTSEHIDAIKKYGIKEIHRKSFVSNFI